MTTVFISVSLCAITVVLLAATFLLPFGRSANNYIINAIFANESTYIDVKHNSFYRKTIKRLLDIIFSLILILLTMPLMLIIALSIKFEDGGPVLFRQCRITKNNKLFYLRKFRSMIIDDRDRYPLHFTPDNDTRITKVGNVIRKLGLDDLPVLFSIIKGDMSFIGTPCLRPEESEIIGSKIAYDTLQDSYDNVLWRSKPGYISYRDLLFKLHLTSSEGYYPFDWNNQVYYTINYYNHESLKLDLAILTSSISANIADRIVIDKIASELSDDKHSHTNEQN